MVFYCAPSLLNLLKIEDLFRLNLLKLFYKYKHNNLPSYFHKFNFRQRSNVHSYITRYNYKLHEIQTNTKYARKCIRHAIPEIVNNTPGLILDKINSHSFDGFSTYVKYFFLATYSFECTIYDCYVCSNN